MFKKKKILEYDKSLLTPVIRVSICTGEKTAGFIENKSKKFKEIMLIKDDNDLLEFKNQYGITGDIKHIY